MLQVKPKGNLLENPPLLRGGLVFLFDSDLQQIGQAPPTYD